MTSNQDTTDRPSDDVIATYDGYVMPIAEGYDPFAIDRAEWTTMVTAEGEEYLDCFSGISVTNAGHNHPDAVDAVKGQFDELVYTCSYVYRNRPVADLAERLAEITPDDVQKTFFCNSGTEAIEGAIKLVCTYTGAKEVVALEDGLETVR
ncbi:MULTISPECIES: aminotransferase class III-fold pyridoxal phosphate-dependent enzyme [Natrialbaceae]|uniref:aminotransferase class III-fold pyridoxal phosphate-dependent enzyme n=1 Tax=Natrialbaceae TaxID=1644061 RepID=UPI00207D49CD|nr:aminotransferase class III-fold pyridoxal phosphate-dependent enzyme [Natronococcus sp. CG52]